MALRVGSLQAAVSAESIVDRTIKIKDLLGNWSRHEIPSSGPADTPQALCIEWQPGYAMRPHFHAVDQFVLVVGGSGHLGKRPLRPGSVQYARAYTPYGPLVAGEEGLTWMLFRAQTDKTMIYAPAPAHLRKNRKPRMEVVDVALDRAESETLLGPCDDGLQVSRHIVPPGSAIEFSTPPSSGGRVAVVLSGEIRIDGQSYPQRSCMFGLAGDTAVEIRSGHVVADLLFLTFPTPIP